MYVAAGEKGLGAAEQLGPLFREVMRDEGLEGARELDRDRAGRGRGEQRKDVALQSRAISEQDRLVVWPQTRRLGTVRRCDAVFDPDRNGLAGSAASRRSEGVKVSDFDERERFNGNF